jgi:hypothetical protein
MRGEAKTSTTAAVDHAVLRRFLCCYSIDYRDNSPISGTFALVQRNAERVTWVKR